MAPKPIPERLGEKLKMIRESRRWSLDRMAEAVGKREGRDEEAGLCVIQAKFAPDHGEKGYGEGCDQVMPEMCEHEEGQKDQG